jgi:sodium/hydrogen antiporter
MMEQMNTALAVTGAVVIVVGLLSNSIKKSLLQALIAVLVGIAAGPYGLSWLDVARWGMRMPSWNRLHG